MDPRITELKEALRAMLEARQDVVAAWEGGSAATGFLDEHSDLDLLIVLKEGSPADPVFEAMAELFDSRWGILTSFRMPEPAWHGLSQCFYLLDKLPSLFYCDIAVTGQETPHKLTEPERHGHAVIWFDPHAIYHADPMPEAELNKLKDRVFAMATGTWWLMLMELKKSLARDNWLSALSNYNALLGRHVVGLMNLKYRPWKADFGSRYAERDYPPEAADELIWLTRVATLEDIRERLPRLEELYLSLKQELSPVL